jgi:hypothetical protein
MCSLHKNFILVIFAIYPGIINKNNTLLIRLLCHLHKLKKYLKSLLTYKKQCVNIVLQGLNLANNKNFKGGYYYVSLQFNSFPHND